MHEASALTCFVDVAIPDKAAALEKFINDSVVVPFLSIKDIRPLELRTMVNTTLQYDVLGGKNALARLDRMLARLVSDRALIGWTTFGHSGIDVLLYAHGKGAESLRNGPIRQIENTQVFDYMVDFLALRTEITRLRQNTPERFFGTRAPMARTKNDPQRTKEANPNLLHFHDHPPELHQHVSPESQ